MFLIQNNPIIYDSSSVQNKLTLQNFKKPTNVQTQVFTLFSLVINELSINRMSFQLQKYFKEEILRVLFQDSRLTLQQSLDKLQLMKQSAGYGKGGVCRRILRIRDVGYKCYDCSKDSTAMLCKDCFENGGHFKHRFTQLENCDGCCDCGDSSTIRQEGFCKQHKGFDKYSKNDINNAIGEDKVKYISDLIKCMFYFTFQISELQQNYLYDSLFSLVNNFISMISESTPMMQYLIYLILKSPCNNEMLHCCFDEMQLFIRRQARIINPNCQCSFLDLIFRYNLLLQDSTCLNLTDLFISMFCIYDFKKLFICSYAKNFGNLFKLSESLHFRQSNILQLSMQLFQDDLLTSTLLQNEQYIVCCMIATLEDVLKVILQKQSTFYYSIWIPLFVHISHFITNSNSLFLFVTNKAFVFQFLQLLAMIDEYPLFINDQYQINRFSEFPLDLIFLEYLLLSFMMKIISFISEFDTLFQFYPSINMTSQQFLLILLKMIILKILKKEKKLSYTESFINPLSRTFSQIILKLFNPNKQEFTSSQISNGILSSNIIMKIDIIKFCSKMRITQTDFQKALNYSLTQCFSTLSLIKKLQSNYYMLGGQDIIRSTYNIYMKEKYTFQSLDISFIQLGLQIQFSLQPFQEKFFSRYIKCFFSELSLLDSSNALNKMRLFHQAIDILTFILIDESAQNNALLLDLKNFEDITQNFLKSAPGLVEIIYQREQAIQARLFPFLINYIQQFPNFTFQEIKNDLYDTVLHQRASLYKILDQIADFDSKKRRFTVKKEFAQQIVDPHLLHANCVAEGNYIEFVNQNFRGSEQVLIRILGKNTLYKKKFLSFINVQFCEDFFSQVDQFISNFALLSLEDKGVVLYIYESSLKLVNYIIQIAEQQLITDSINAQQMLKMTVKYLFSVSKQIKTFSLSIDSIIIPTDYMIKSIVRVLQENDLIISDIDQLQEYREDELLIKKQKMLNRKEQMKKMFKIKSESFYKNNQIEDDGQSNIIQRDCSDNICMICRCELTENELNGSCAFLGYSNLFNYLTYWSGKYECWKLAFTNQKDKETVQNLESSLQEFLYEIKNMKGAPQFEQCDHRIHFKCFFKIQPTKNNQQDEFLCPQCKSVSNIFLPELKQIFVNEKWQFSEQYKHLDSEYFNKVLEPNKFQMTELIHSQINEVFQRLSIVNELSYQKEGLNLEKELENSVISEINQFIELYDWETQIKKFKLIQKVYNLYYLVVYQNFNQGNLDNFNWNQQYFNEFLNLFNKKIKNSNKNDKLPIKKIEQKSQTFNYNGEEFQKFLLSYLINFQRNQKPTQFSKSLPYELNFMINETELMENKIDFQLLKCSLFASLVDDHQKLQFMIAYGLIIKAIQCQKGSDDIMSTIYCSKAINLLLKKLLLLKLARNNDQSIQVLNDIRIEYILEQFGVNQQHFDVILPLFESKVFLRMPQIETKLYLNVFLSRWGDMVHLHYHDRCYICSGKSKLHMCFICGDILCGQRCETGTVFNIYNNLMTHTIRHEYSCMFLNLTDARVAIVNNQKLSYTDTLYCNKFGEEFILKAQDWNEYKLDEEQLQWLWKRLLMQSDRYG